MKILKRMTLIVSILSILYAAGFFILPHTQYSYRMWTNVCGSVLAALVLPLLLLLLAGIWMWKKAGLHRAVKVIFSLAAAGIYLFWGFWVLVFMLFTAEEEKHLTGNLLVVNEADFLEESTYAYYRPVAFLFREPGKLTEADQVEYLEEKYDRNFYITGYAENEDADFGWDRGEENGDADFKTTENRICDEKFPQLRVSVYQTGMELEDNYPEALAVMWFRKGISEYGIERDFYVAKNYAGRSGWLYLELDGKEDIEDFAADASKLIRYLMENTDFFEENRGLLCFYCGEGEEKLTGNIPFGQLSMWDELAEDYYLDTVLLTERVRDEYKDAEEFQKRLAANREKYEKMPGSETENEVQSGTKTENAEETPAAEMVSPIEAAAKIIYDAVLADQGYLYTACYNAKGNFYLDLGERAAGMTEDKSSTGIYRFTLVYDRTSKNGACELFVLYKEHYEENADGSRTLDGTAILDIYAVETATGKVAASGRRAWSDLGTQEYREMTGE